MTGFKRIAEVVVVTSIWVGGVFAAQTLFVDAGALEGGDGQAWTTAYNDLQDALEAAALINTEPVEIRVAAGVYKPTIPNGDQSVSFVLQSNLALYGGFPIGGGDWESRDPELNETILSGDLNGDDEPGFVNYEENTTHVLYGIECLALTIDGFVIEHGAACDDYQHFIYGRCGGGLYLQYSEYSIENCIFRENYADESGGAIYVEGLTSRDYVPIDDHAAIKSCRFVGNRARMFGGGIYMIRSNMSVLDCEFLDNDVREFSGGAVMVQGGAPTFLRCRFEGNKRFDDLNWFVSGGGAMFLAKDYFAPSTPKTFAPKIVQCVFKQNHSQDVGGAILAESSDGPIVENSIFEMNTAVSCGGAIAIHDDGGIALRNCLIVGNRAASCGGLGADEVTTTCKADIRNCVFAGNVADSHAGYWLTHPSELVVVNCIVYGNIPAEAQAMGTSVSPNTRSITLDEQEPVLDVHNCCVELGIDAETIIDADPMFVDPGHWDDNGTPEDTSDDTWVMGDYRLQPGSPCIDAGDNTAIPTGLVTDHADNYRRWDDPATTDTGVGTAPIVDMGAYEYASHIPGDMNCDGVVDGFDVNAFVIALVEPEGYASQYPDCDAVLADCNGDATIDVFDIDAFVAALVGV